MKSVYDDELFSEIRPHILKKFMKFHHENPHVWEILQRFAYEAKKSGRERFGISMIYERMRWYMNIETTDKVFKLSNDHRSCYARLLMITDPFFRTLFVRKVTVKKYQQQSFL